METLEINDPDLNWLDVYPVIDNIAKKYAITASMLGSKLRAIGDPEAIKILSEYMKKPTSTIDRDPGTKKECIGMLRRAMVAAQTQLDNGKLHTAIFSLEQELAAVKKKLPREKITKPFKG